MIGASARMGPICRNCWTIGRQISTGAHKKLRSTSFRTTKRRLTAFPIHFVYEKGKGPNPTPLILSHGWPWTFWDWHKVIGPLTDPAAYGGDPADSFDVIVPSLPGFGFSTPLTTTGFNFWRSADLWVSLMREVLGYDKFCRRRRRLGFAHNRPTGT